MEGIVVIVGTILVPIAVVVVLSLLLSSSSTSSSSLFFHRNFYYYHHHPKSYYYYSKNVQLYSNQYDYHHQQQKHEQEQQAAPPPPSQLDEITQQFKHCTTGTCSSHIYPIPTGWKVCRPPIEWLLRHQQQQQQQHKMKKKSHHNDDDDNNTMISIASCSSFYRNTVKPKIWDVPTLPTTALLVLLDNNNYYYESNNDEIVINGTTTTTTKSESTTNSNSSSSNLDFTTTESSKFATITSDNIYYSNNLEQLPDISIVGREYYTLLYEYNISDLARSISNSQQRIFNDVIVVSSIQDDDKLVVQQQQQSRRRRMTSRNMPFSNNTINNNDTKNQKLIIRFAGFNYRATVFVDGIPVPEINQLTSSSSHITSTTSSSVDGMFHRRSYDISHGKHTVAVLIEPPDHPGTCRLPQQQQQQQQQNDSNNSNSNTENMSSSSTGTQPSSSSCTGQGGNHALAMDGPVPQYMLGWDWAQAIPDRSTGFLGSVIVEANPNSIYSILDPTVITKQLVNCSWYSRSSSNSRRKRYICQAIHISILARIECVVTIDTISGNNNDGSVTSNLCDYNTSNMTLRVTPDWSIQSTGPSKTTTATINNTMDSTSIILNGNMFWNIPIAVLDNHINTASSKKPVVRKFTSSSSHRDDTRGTVTYVSLMDIEQDFIIEQQDNLDKVHLWWPHGVLDDYDDDDDDDNNATDPSDNEQTAYLHSFTFALLEWDNNVRLNETYNCDDSFEQSQILDEKLVQIGLRTVETYVDETIQGQAFQINGYKVYLVGGNWIGTDATFRLTANYERYYNEISLHKKAGINLLRVWGGGIAETDDFYTVTDRLGILVYQEFWMTGDNNGRWAGNLSWPLNDSMYLANVEDTIRRLRVHVSLLFYGGCNECLDSPTINNPRSTIDQGIRNAINLYDPGRFYITSSMGGPNIADQYHYNINPNSIYMNRSYSLSYADGPYHLLLPYQFYERNPGLSFPATEGNGTIRIGFQPEIGSTNTPTYEGLLRFMSEDDVNNGFPRRDSDTVGRIWDFHRYQSWRTPVYHTKTNTTTYYDQVYAYFPTMNYGVNASDWAAAAQLAGYAQCQYLFGGFVSHIYEYTSTVIYWKSQTPWPSLRGFLYDWFLETTGSYRGTKSILANPVSIIYDPLLFVLRIVNRRVHPLCICDSCYDMYCLSNTKGYENIGAEYSWIALNGTIVSTRQVFLVNHTFVPSMTAIVLGDPETKENRIVLFPTTCGEVCFLRIQPILPTSRNLQPTWYWITDPAKGNASDYSALGVMRSRQATIFSLSTERCRIVLESDSHQYGIIHVETEIHVDVKSPDVLFYPTFSMHTLAPNNATKLTATTIKSEQQQERKPLLPLWDNSDTDVVILPGTTKRSILQSTVQIGNGTQFEIVLSSWNAARITQILSCTIEWI